MSDQSFSILSLTGGGARGIFQASFLRNLNGGSTLIREFKFDLLAGTSTGSIVAMALAFEIDLELVEEFFISQSSSVFKSRLLSGFRRGAKYDQQTLRSHLKSVFGKKRLGDAHRPIIISASSADNYSHRLFFGDGNQESGDNNLSVVDIVLASCAAPTYFPAVSPEQSTRTYLDGGLWANDPTFAAITFAHQNFGVPLGAFRALTIGNGEFPQGAIQHEINQLRTFNPSTISMLFDLMFQTQESASDFYTKQMIGQANHIRISPALRQKIALDDAANANAILPPLAEVEADRNQRRIEELLGKSNREDENGIVGIKCDWGVEQPSSTDILPLAEQSILLMGTSLHRIVHGDFFEFQDWLNADDSRQMALLFLNPHSPHARGRERDGVHRSESRMIVEAIRKANSEAQSNPKIDVGVYDGPYRYSARAFDISKDRVRKGAKIQILTSTHTRGISSGFKIGINSDGGPALHFYRKDLHETWKTAKSNVPGHGISAVAKPNLEIGEETCRLIAAQLADEISSNELDFYFFGARQQHLTLVSLCRSQKNMASAPFSIGYSHDEENLPAHFGEFAVLVYQALKELPKDRLVFTLDTATITDRGLVILQCKYKNEATIMVKEFRDAVASMVASLNERFPNEGWDDVLLDSERPRFGPEIEPFIPHITIGTAFESKDTLASPLTGVVAAIPLLEPISVAFSKITIGHYAYRTYLRTVGEVGIELLESPDAKELLCRLAIDFKQLSVVKQMGHVQ